MLPRLRLLHWTTAAVLGIAASLLAHDIHGAGRRAHAPVAIAVGTAELLGAVLFVVPATVRIGGALPLLTLVAAAAVHGAMGEAPPLAYLVYAAAVWTVAREYPRTRRSA